MWKVAKGCLIRGDDTTVSNILDVFADLAAVSPTLLRAHPHARFHHERYFVFLAFVLPEGFDATHPVAAPCALCNWTVNEYFPSAALRLRR